MVAIFAYVLRVSLDEFEMLVKGSPLVQANIVAVCYCVIITGYTGIFDVRSWYREQNNYRLPDYYNAEKAFVDMMDAIFILYSLVLCVGLAWFIGEIFVRNCCRTLTINQGSALIDGKFCRRAMCLVILKMLAQKMLIKQLNK